MKKLNLGCGEKWREQYPDYQGLDIIDYDQPLVGNVLDILPKLDSDNYVEVMANHFLEHFNHEELSKIFQEVHRILKPQGIFRIAVPSKESAKAYVLTHKTFWTEEAFKALEYDWASSWRLFNKWQIKRLVVNERLDIHCQLMKI